MLDSETEVAVVGDSERVQPLRSVKGQPGDLIGASLLEHSVVTGVEPSVRG
jgi:hypothetical protein